MKIINQLFFKKNAALIPLVLFNFLFIQGCNNYDFAPSGSSDSPAVASSSSDQQKFEVPPVVGEPQTPQNPVTDVQAPPAAAVSPTPAPATNPPPPQPHVVRCDVLVDKTGIYFDFLTSKTNYIAVTGITECAYNEINKIQGPCDNSTEFTILRPNDINNINSDELLKVNPGSSIQILPGGSLFLCYSLQDGIVVSTQFAKVVFVK